MSSVAGSPDVRRQSTAVEVDYSSVPDTPQAHLNDARRSTSIALINLFADQVSLAQKDGTFTLPKGKTPADIAKPLGLQVEQAMYVNLCGGNGEPNQAYREKLRTILFNVKKNASLRDRLLSGSLLPSELSTMATEEMASKELQRKTAEMKEAAEKQHILITEDGPRIRRTHKGEEFVGDEYQHMGGMEPEPSHPPPRRESVVEPSPAQAASPETESQHKVEAPEVPMRSPTAANPLRVDTKKKVRPDRRSSSNFNIQDVWSSVSQDKSAPPHTPYTPGPQGQADVQADPEIDDLLKDEKEESEPPYSPRPIEEDEGPDPNDPTVLWRGKIMMNDLADFRGRARYCAGGNSPDPEDKTRHLMDWSDMIPRDITIDGRIAVEKASEYLCGLQFSQTTDVCVVAVTPNDTEADCRQFDKLFQYFSSRKRYGVVSKHPEASVKDTYVVPVEKGENTLPEFVELLRNYKLARNLPERVLFLTFVVRAQQTSSSQATPKQPDTPFTPAADRLQQTPLPFSHQGSQMSPPAPTTYGQPSQADHYGSTQPPHQQHAPTNQSYPQYPPYTAQASQSLAHQILGPLVNAPAIQQLLSQAPHIGAQELSNLQDVVNKVPAAASDYEVLVQVLSAGSKSNSAPPTHVGAEPTTSTGQ